MESRAALVSAEPFGRESFDPELMTEGLRVERLVAGLATRNNLSVARSNNQTFEP